MMGLSASGIVFEWSGVRSGLWWGRGWLRCQPVALGALALLAVGLAVGGLAVSARLGSHAVQPAARARSGWDALPVSARVPVSAALGRDDLAYRVRGLSAVNPAQHLDLNFGSAAVTVRSGGARLSLHLVGLGRAGGLRALAPAAPLTSGNRVSYRRGVLSEWYVNGPLGLEQGFDLAQRPAGRGVLALAVAVGSSLRARPVGRDSIAFADPGGRTVLRYGGLVASDAHGRALPAWLSVSSGKVLIGVDDRGARYPLRVDPFIQQQTLTAASGTETGNGGFGFSVAVSSDGSTTLIGGPDDNNGGGKAAGAGAAWVFTRSGSTWIQQQKLTAASGTETGNGAFGASVALSSDGSTAVIGGPTDNNGGTGSGVGAVWVFTRSGATFTQQQRLTAASGTETGNGAFGFSVAVSSDGSTALIGGPGDDNSGSTQVGVGAAWVFTRAGATFSQQQKLTAASGTETGSGGFGLSVALSSDGSTAVIGGPGDGNGGGAEVGVGAAWVFTRSGPSFTQQQKLVAASGTETGNGAFGFSVAVSSDGSTALIGGPYDNNGGGKDPGPGAAWVFTRSGATFTQQQRLTATSGTENGQGGFGLSVALSSDGSTALIGGPNDNRATGVGVGAAWVFTRSGATFTQQQRLTAASGTETGYGAFGAGVAVSSDGSIALIGGPYDNNGGSKTPGVGAAWVFAAPTTAAPHTVTVTEGGTGSGVVTSSPAGISCPGSCAHSYPNSTIVSLSATPAAGSAFAGWSGACLGTGACTVTLSADRVVTATFVPLPAAIAKLKAKVDKRHHKARFTFNAGTAASGFQCTLVKRPKKHKKAPKVHFSGCTSPKTYKHLKHGKYTFEVRALSSSGAGPIAKRNFKV